MSGSGGVLQPVLHSSRAWMRGSLLSRSFYHTTMCMALVSRSRRWRAEVLRVQGVCSRMFLFSVLAALHVEDAPLQSPRQHSRPAHLQCLVSSRASNASGSSASSSRRRGVALGAVVLSILFSNWKFKQCFEESFQLQHKRRTLSRGEWWAPWPLFFTSRSAKRHCGRRSLQVRPGWLWFPRRSVSAPGRGGSVRRRR